MANVKVITKTSFGNKETRKIMYVNADIHVVVFPT